MPSGLPTITHEREFSPAGKRIIRAMRLIFLEVRR